MGLPNVEELKQKARELGLEGEESKKWLIEEYRIAREKNDKEEDEERGRKKMEEDEERDKRKEERAFKREEESKRLEHIRIMELKASEEETPRVEEKSTGNSGK